MAPAQEAAEVRQTGQSRIGLALAGGAPGGAIYEIGALRALDEALGGIDFNQLRVYVGVSAGAFLAANLANSLTPAQMCRAIVKHDPTEHPFHSSTFLQPASRELARCGSRVPRLLWESLNEYLRNPLDGSLLDSLTRVGRALPTGLFKSEPIREYLHRIYSLKGRTDDFRQLEKKLFVVAVDLDSGVAVRFGEEGFDSVPISVAVQASIALPGLYPPVEIDGRHYVDGVLRKTLHASAALQEGVDLLICLNPIVPVDTRRAVEKGVMKRGKLIDRGWPTVVSQSLRTLIRSRLRVGMDSYSGRFDADIVLLEPRRDDYLMFFNNIFSFSARRDVCEHAYHETRRELRERREELEPVFARHGIRLRHEILDQKRNLWTGVRLPSRPEAGDLGANGTLGELSDLLDRLDGYLAKEMAG